MVSKKRYSYIRDCAKLNGSSKYIEHIKGFLDSKKYKQIKEFMDKKRYSVLTHLKLYTALDRRNNHVLMVGFPGDRVSLRRMPTPELSDFMYYMFRFWDDNKKSLQTPLYILGHAFDDTHLRKFSLLKKFTRFRTRE